MLTIDPDSRTPPFEQLRLHFVEQITAGTMPAGSRLPTVRSLAEQTGLAPNTVARCYRELEASGVVVTRGRNGTVVAWSADAAQREVEQAARDFAERVRRLAVDRDAALTMVRAALEL